MEKVFNTGQEFFIDSTPSRYIYIYQEPPEQKIITCCEANWNAPEQRSQPRNTYSLTWVYWDSPELTEIQSCLDSRCAF